MAVELDLLDEAKTAVEYTVQDGDTLAKIAQANGIANWRVLALYNWGTVEPREVNRALFECVGWAAAVEDHPGNTILKPHADAKKKIRVPKVWKSADLAVDAVHTIQVKPHPKPPTAIRIRQLDRWFIPETESCDFAYALEGLKECADKVDFEVWASNYAKAAAADEFEFSKCTYTPVDVPVRKEVLTRQSEERQKYSITKWKGESNTTDGILKPAAGKKRYVNVACSPYTVLLRYYKADADKTARIVLEPFWPAFKADGKPDEATLHVGWNVKNSNRFADGNGTLLIFDKTGEVVFRKPLSATELSEKVGGPNDFLWKDGRYSPGTKQNSKAGDSAIWEDMPYRVQIQMHTKADEANGLALAAMQTEVRLYVHPEVGTHPADPLQDPQCFQFRLAPHLPDPTLAKKNGTADQKTRWRKLQLAQSGFPCGPVNKDDAVNEYLIGVREFQRSVPVDGGARASPRYSRLTANGTIDANTDKALSAPRRRAVFSDPDSDRADMKDPAKIAERLNDKAEEIIVWVENRHYYTKAAAADLPAAVMQMEDYGGDMDIDDAARIGVEEKSVARPWIPIEISLPLLSKKQGLRYAPAKPPAVTAAMRHAIGPIRVDWIFLDLEPDLTILQTDSANYNGDGNNWTRTWRFVRDAVNDAAAVYKGHTFANCPKKYGGERPGDPPADKPKDMNTYYKAVFGLDDAALLPWRAAADSATETVCVHVHDDLAAANQKYSEPRAGRAGVYLNPSRIAGDGYRFRAQVSFSPHPQPDRDHPNRAVLEKRYPKLAQAHTCGIRLWRKTSFRAHSNWASGAVAAGAAALPDYGNLTAGVLEYYSAAHVHFVHQAGSATILPLSGLLSPTKVADVNAYRDAIDTRILAASRADYPAKNLMKLKATNYWPWLDEKNYGLPWNKQVLTMAGFETWIYDTVKDETTDRFHQALMFLLLHRVETKFGLLTGHFSCPWSAFPELWRRMYICSAGAAHEVVVPERSQAARQAAGAACPSAGCAGVLQRAYIKYYRCTACAATYAQAETVAHPDAFQGANCPGCGGVGTLTANAAGQSPPHRSDYTIRSGYSPGLGESAVGEPLGGLWLYLSVEEGVIRTMTHEFGHNRHLSHTYAVHHGLAWAADYQKWHDFKQNTVGAIPPGDAAISKDRWDRRCMMSYFKNPVPANNAGNYDRLRYFCGKCILKFRGWKVENLSLDSGKHDGNP